MDLDSLGELLWNKFSQAIGVLFVMFAIIIGVGKVWDKSWNMAIKFTMALVVVITEIACIMVVSNVIGIDASKTFGNMF